MVPRRGDLIPVQVQAADGPTIVWFTPEEYATHWSGVDPTALTEEDAVLTEEENDPESKE